MKYLVLLVNTFFVVAMAQRHHQQQQHQQQHHNHQQPQQQQKQRIVEEPLPDSKYRNIPIVSHSNVLGHDGSFNYAFENGDGTRVQQNGELKQSDFDPKNAGEAVQGEYSYQGDDGQTYQLTYIADEFGYRPQGAHLPTP